MSTSPLDLLALEIVLKFFTSKLDMEAPSTPTSRLQAIVGHVSSPSSEGETLVVVLPDGGKVTASLAKIDGHPNDIILNGSIVLSYNISQTQSFAFDISSVGTRYQGATTHLPRYKLLALNAPKNPTARLKDVSIAEFWVAIYALYTLYHTQEQIPVVFSQFPNADEIRKYLMTSGLAQIYPTSKLVPKKPEAGDDILFISRSAFWQGAGTMGFHNRSWLLDPRPIIPNITSYTRTDKVISMHPLRPQKPQAGEVLYRRWCSSVGQMLELTYFDLEGEHDGTRAAGKGISRHMAAFHRWHNDERVNSAWGERGSLETHREYVEGMLEDPHALPCMISWDGELMGYVELVYTKEDHSAQHYPSDIAPGQWERGLHVLVGEPRFAGRSEIWIRSLVHYMFLADPRTDRIIGEPSEANKPIIRVAMNTGFHIHTIIDFPYKRSVMVLHPREKFFKMCKLL